MKDEEIGKPSGSGKRTAKQAFAAILVFAGLLAFIYGLSPVDFLLYVKAFHVIAVISWMAGLLYLPRLFIYHTDSEPGSVQSETFKVMEQRLLKIIMNPAMMLSWVLGLYLAITLYGMNGVWLHAKIGFVVLLTVVHIIFSHAVKNFASDKRQRTARYWRLMNELPTVLMIAIVILVIVKPF